ncbi:UbiA prenyltransferase family [Cristinia sonorae]|uniref:UbiA prenyltransferase family n=1 Tax=Cristinia sonorae TaxID=1940300 RepID=A0A8K0UUS7_9AGAR|nr:UbiA prenyltransferase family [Cristinia sonorae]
MSSPRPLTTIEQIGYYLHTLHRFCRSNYKTTLFPVSFFALACAPQLKLSHICHVVAWLWLHILHFDLSNQTIGVEEDRVNKPDRPIPDGRISLESAITLRWIVFPICLLYSLSYSVQVFYASFVLAILTVIYNEWKCARKWYVKNSLNGAGYACFQLGATLIASANRSKMDSTAWTSILISACILTSTIHAQDVKDVLGDTAIGRLTLPAAHPKIARRSILVGLVLWTGGLIQFWKLDAATSVVLMALALLTGYRFVALSSIRDDSLSYILYNLWVSCVYALPGYYRWMHPV